MKTAVLAALLLLPATASAQDDEFYSLRWTVAAGPSVASPSGNVMILTGVKGCLTCGRTQQRVIGADDSKYHAALNVGGDIKYNITLRGELMYNHSQSPFQRPPARVCQIYKCYQNRKAMKDDAYMLGGGLEWTPVKNFPVIPYITATGGLGMNRVRWTWDTTGTQNAKLDGNARAFGSYASGGLGARVKAKSVIVFAEARMFQTFSTPGTALASFSFGLQYWARFRNYGY